MDEQTKVLVWRKGTVIPGYDPTQWRRDEYGNALSFAAYDDRNSDYGWEIDHIRPVAEGGADAIANFRPLRWRVNAGRQ